MANRPVLSYVVEQLRAEGVEEMIAITGHLAPQIEAYMADEHPEMPVRYVEQVSQRGTADAIALAEPYVNGPVLIVFVDTLFDADFGVIQRESDAAGIIWAKEVEDYQRFGVVLTDESGYMERIIEKPSEPVSKLANIGLYYIRDYELLFEGVRHVLSQDPNLGEYFLTDAFQYMIDRGARLYTAEVGGWFDCGKPETVLDTNRVMLERGHGGDLSAPDSVTIEGDVALGEDVVIVDSRLGPNVSVAGGSTVRGSKLADTIVGASSTIEACDLSSSIIGDHVTLRGVKGSVNVGDHSEIDALER